MTVAQVKEIEGEPVKKQNPMFIAELAYDRTVLEKSVETFYQFDDAGKLRQILINFPAKHRTPDAFKELRDAFAGEHGKPTWEGGGLLDLV